MNQLKFAWEFSGRIPARRSPVIHPFLRYPLTLFGRTPGKRTVSGQDAGKNFPHAVEIPVPFGQRDAGIGGRAMPVVREPLPVWISVRVRDRE